MPIFTTLLQSELLQNSRLLSEIYDSEKRYSQRSEIDMCPSVNGPTIINLAPQSTMRQIP